MEQQSNSAIIEQMVKEATSAPEPGTLKSGQVISKGDDDISSPQVLNRLKSAGYVYIWDTVTGELSVTNANMLRQQLGKKREDGSTVFTTINPHITVKRGTLKCMLHKDDPNRKHYDELGLAVCPKDNLTAPYQVLRHMMKRHHQEWATLEQERQNAERESDRAFQRQLFGKASSSNPTDRLDAMVSDRAVKTTVDKAMEGIDAKYPEKPQETAVSGQKDETTGGTDPLLDYDNAPVYVSDKPAKEKSKKRKRRS